MSGGVVSTTVMVWLQKATLLHVSIAIHVRVVLKAFEHEGLGKTVIFETTVMFVITPSQASTAVGVVNTTGANIIFRDIHECISWNAMIGIGFIDGQVDGILDR